MSTPLQAPIAELPSATYAESAFIAGIFESSHRYVEFRDVLAPADFALEKHKLVWLACGRLYQAGSKIDRVTLWHALSPQERDSIGGLTGLSEIDCIEVVALESYAALIRQAAIKRRLILGANELVIAACQHGASADEMIERARGMVQSIEVSASSGSEFQTPLDVIQDAGGIDAYLRQGSEAGIPLPWPRVQSLVGGLQPGDLAILAADTGRGKTAAALNIALRAAELGYGTAVFSLEMTRRQLLNRLMALSGHFNSYVFRQQNRSLVDLHLIGESAGHLADLPLWIRDATGCTVSGLVGAVQRLRAKRDVRLVVVDYLQLMAGDGRSRVEQVAAIARGLKNAAMELKLPIVALSQLSRDHSKNKSTPELHDLKESSEIEQAANMVMFLHGETVYSTIPSELLPIDLIIAKQRADCGYFAEADR
jgi:replicative DNA helicase